MSGGDGLDQLRQQFGITPGGTTTTAPAAPRLGSIVGGGGSSGGSVPSSGGGLDELRRQFGISGSPSGSSSSGPAASQAAAVQGAPSHKGFLGRLVSDAKEGLGGLVHLPIAAAKDIETFAGAAVGQDWGNAGIARQPGESLSEFSARKYPLLGGALVQGPVNLFEHAVHPTQAIRDYSAHPLLGPLGDVATAALFAGPALKAATAAGEGAAEGSTLAGVAKGATVAHDTLENAANPLRPILNGVGPIPGLRAIPERAFQAVQEGSTDPLARVAAKFSRPMHQTSAAILEGQANEAALKGTQARLGKLLTGVISDPDEQAAAIVVGEQTAPALAALRQHLGADQFAQYVENRYKGTLTVKAANLAADVADGKAPELAAKTGQFLQTYHDAIGGQGERTAAFLAKPGHEYQAGYEANPAAVKAAVDEAGKGLPRLAKMADQAKDRAVNARQVAEDAATRNAGAVEQRSADATARQAESDARAATRTLEAKRSVMERAVERQQGRSIAAVDRLTSAQDLAEAAKVAQRTPDLEPLFKAGGRTVAASGRAAEAFDKGSVGSAGRIGIAEQSAERFGKEAGKVQRLGEMEGRRVGAATERATAAQRVARLESSRLGALTGRLERLPDEPNLPKEKQIGVKPTYAMGEQEGRLQTRARVLGNIADQAEARVGKIQTAAERARINAEQSVENAPARLKPALAENRAAAHTLVGVVNDLRSRGLDEAARQAEDTIGTLPTALGDLKTQGVDTEHFFHTQTAASTKGGIANGTTLPRTFTAGSEKLRTGSPVYDRTVAGQLKGAEEAGRAQVRQATAEKIGTMPGVAARLGQGPLEGVHNAEEALGRGYVPWSPSAIFDKAGKVRPLDQLDEALSIEHPQVFLPKPVFDEFRNYFEPRRGQVLGAFLDPANRIRFMANLALKPGYIVARIFGHALLGFGGTSDPIGLARNLATAYDQWKTSAEDVAQRHFPDIPPRLLHGQADAAEYARMVNDTGPGKGGRLEQAASKIPGKGLTDLGTKAMRRPMQLAGFMDNVQRAAFYLTEKSKVGGEQALETSLRALGEFDRATPIERDYVRRIIPFWQWHKELTRIAFHLAEDHPLRVAWTLHLGHLVSQPDTSVGNQWQQALHLGPYSIDAGSLSPFNQVPDTFGGGAFGIGKIAGTVPQLVYAAATGEKPSTGRPFTGPPGSAQTVRPTAPSLTHLFGQTLPQVRLWGALTGRDKNQRYDTGDLKLPASNRYQPLPNQYGTGLGQLSSFLGLPVQRTADLQADEAKYAAAKAKAEKQSAKSQQRYQGRLGRLTGP